MLFSKCIIHNDRLSTLERTDNRVDREVFERAQSLIDQFHTASVREALYTGENDLPRSASEWQTGSGYSNFSLGSRWARLATGVRWFQNHRDRLIENQLIMNPNGALWGKVLPFDDMAAEVVAAPHDSGPLSTTSHHLQLLRKNETPLWLSWAVMMALFHQGSYSQEDLIGRATTVMDGIDIETLEALAQPMSPEARAALIRQVISMRDFVHPFLTNLGAENLPSPDRAKFDAIQPAGEQAARVSLDPATPKAVEAAPAEKRGFFNTIVEKCLRSKKK